MCAATVPLPTAVGSGEDDEAAAPSARAGLGPARVEELCQRASLARAESAELLHGRDLELLQDAVALAFADGGDAREELGDAHRPGCRLGSASARRSSAWGEMTRIATSFFSDARSRRAATARRDAAMRSTSGGASRTGGWGGAPSVDQPRIPRYSLARASIAAARPRRPPRGCSGSRSRSRTMPSRRSGGRGRRAGALVAESRCQDRRGR